MTAIDDLLSFKAPLSEGKELENVRHYYGYPEEPNANWVKKLKRLPKTFTESDVYKALNCKETVLKLHWSKAGLPIILPHLVKDNSVSSYTPLLLDENFRQIIADFKKNPDRSNLDLSALLTPAELSKQIDLPYHYQTPRRSRTTLSVRNY